jgi:hypothetical protein
VVNEPDKPILNSGETNDIKVREFYNDFVPPRYVLGLIVRMLTSVPAKYTNGLDCVVLTNQSGAPRRKRLGKVTSRKRRPSQDGVLGLYHRAFSGKPAWIELYVDNIAKSVSYHPWVPLGRTACFGLVLFHEIGHHVHATVRPEYAEKEDVADDWGKKLLGHYFLKRYRFVPRPVLRIVGRVLKAIAAEL